MSRFNANDYASNLTGIPGVSEVKMVTTTSATAGPKTFWGRWFTPHSNHYTTVKAAEASLVGGINEVVLLSGESHSLSESLTWDKNLSYLVGAVPETFMNHRSRLSMSTTFTPMMTVSGYGNHFRNLYFQHGTAVGDYVGVDITGSRNTFQNCHFAGPMSAAQASDANFNEVYVHGVSETYFKNCVFGNHTRSCDEATSLLKIGAGGGITILENCIFLMRVTAGQTDPLFVYIDNATDTGITIFRSCMFIADPTFGTPAVAISFAGSGLGYALIDYNCQFCNVSLIASNSQDSYLRLGTVYGIVAAADDAAMIMQTPSYT